MRSLKSIILEKLKVRNDTTITSDYRDDERLGDLSNLATGNNFLYYVYDCLKRDKVKDGGSGFYFGPTKDVISIIYKKFKRNVKYSPDETYIELYNRIIAVLREKHFITEKLKVSSKNIKEYKEYKDKTNRVTKYNAHSYHSIILEVDNVDFFMDYWYHFLETEDEALKENLDLHWDDIYVDYDAHDVYILDNSTGDEITKSSNENPRTFYNAYCRIIEYFEKKNS